MKIPNTQFNVYVCILCVCVCMYTYKKNHGNPIVYVCVRARSRVILYFFRSPGEQRGGLLAVHIMDRGAGVIGAHLSDDRTICV